MTEQNNPLLSWQDFPEYTKIKAEHVEPAIKSLLKESEEKISELETRTEINWKNIMVDLERIMDRLNSVWGVVGHLLSVRNSDDLRKAYENVQGEVVIFHNRVGQSAPLYQAYNQIQKSAEWNSLDPGQQRTIESHIKDANLSGVGLEGENKKRFNDISQKLTELGTTFSNQLLDSIKEFKMVLKEKDEIEGLLPSHLHLAAEAAKQNGFEKATVEEGPWVITMDIPSFLPFMQHSKRRDLRKKVHYAFITRASIEPKNNLPLIDEILKLRKEKAKILGFKTYAELSLSQKMATNVSSVETLLEELKTAAIPVSKRELEEMKAFAAEKNAPEADDLQQCDVPFWAERLKEEKYSLNDEEIRPYFSLPEVLKGLFDLAEKLFSIRVVPADGEVDVWHKDVRFFHIHNENGEKISSFYFDPYSRPAEKRGGAWMDALYGRSSTFATESEKSRLPVAYMVCNQTPPVGDKPSLMSFQEVLTLFHEFGHNLQHLLTTVDCGFVAGIENVEWDAVELPSQFMENWCYDKKTLAGMAKHYETGEALPEELREKLIQARTFRQGNQMTRQIHLGTIDMRLHHQFDPEGTQTPTELNMELSKELIPLPLHPDNRFLASFSHIFAGGYAAGYYSYKWAEVLSADAFAAFEEAGTDNEEEMKRLGKLFKDTVLALGGSQHPMEIFEAFRGRKPSTEPLLRHSGLK